MNLRIKSNFGEAVPGFLHANIQTVGYVVQDTLCPYSHECYAIGYVLEHSRGARANLARATLRQVLTSIELPAQWTPSGFVADHI
jgi:hypothetical protein